MQPVPYLFFRVTCEEAMRAYARIFDAPEPQIMYAKDAPPDPSMTGPATGVMHSALKLGDGWLYASDWSKAEAMAGACVTVSGRDPEETRRWFDALAEGGMIEMPLEQTFWSPAFGGLTDRWGTRWLLDTENPADAGQGVPSAEAVPA